MSNKIIVKDLSGLTMRACLLNDQGEWWNGSTQSFETYNSSNLPDYEITLTETGNTGVYLGTFPSQVPAGAYVLLVGGISGASLQEDDLAAFEASSLAWTGADAVDGQVDVKSLALSPAAANNLKSVVTGTGADDDVDLSARSLTVENDIGDAVKFASTAGTGFTCGGSSFGLYAVGGIYDVMLEDGLLRDKGGNFLSILVAGYADGQTPGDHVLALPENKIVTNSSGCAQADIREIAGDIEPATALANKIGNLDASVSSRATPSDVQVTVQPTIASILADQPGPTIVAYQHARLQAQITVVDAAGDPVDLSGKELAFVAYADADPETAVVELRNYGGQATLSVGGADNNVVTLDGPDSVLPAPGRYRWILRNQTDDTVLPRSAGVLDVRAAADATAA